MHPEKFEVAISVESVAAFEAIDFCTRHSGNLRLIRVKRGEPARDVPAFRELGKRAHEILARRRSARSEHPLARDAERLGETQPQLRMILRPAFRFHQVLPKISPPGH